MSDEVYDRLAATLDKIPNGFPPVPDRSHIKILKWIFEESEADLASQMKLMGETTEDLSARLDWDPANLKEILETMAHKGQIRAWNSSTGRRYALIPFAVGIYEEQLGRMDKEFAKIFEDYYAAAKGIGDMFATEPPIFKVIPVNSAVETDLEIHPYEKAEGLLENSKSWGVRECICKKQKELIGEPCNYPTSVCLVFAPKSENAFDNDELTKAVTKEEALKILKDSEEAGLVHCTMNIQTGQNYICNCCTCCCGVLRGLTQHDQPYAFVKSDFLIEVDNDLCTGCGTCVDRCQFAALDVPEDLSVVNTDRCIGCGVCAISCPEGALQLVARPDRGEKAPPEKYMDWMTEKAMSRGVDPSELM
ncbi:MAG: ATP-binding protein [Candidatus Thorarchaeota archaeon]|jgi:ferredoxin